MPSWVSAIPETCQAMPRLTKPFVTTRVIDAVERMVVIE
jgi:hypothetical protein